MKTIWTMTCLAVWVGSAVATPAVAGQSTDATFTKDIAPILQRSCQNCHRPDSMAPMSLMTYEEVRPWARSIKQRTAPRKNGTGMMPPWFIEKDVGIQDYKDDLSLSDDEIAMIAAWVDNGAPKGDPADLPPPRIFGGPNEWDIGEPDLVVKTPSITMPAVSPDRWDAMAPVPLGLTEDRYVSAVQVKEFSDTSSGGGTGGKFIFHHAIIMMLDEQGDPSAAAGQGWPSITEGRFGVAFDPESGRFLEAGSQILYQSVHLTANGEETTGHLKVAMKFHPRGYTPTKKLGNIGFGTQDIDLRPMEANQVFHFYTTLAEHIKMTTYSPHMHSPGVRFCIEAIYSGRAETLVCSGYDHSWVRAYQFAEDAMPLLPKGTILHGTGYFDNTPANPGIVDPRNWTGFGHRSVDNMLLHIGRGGIVLSDDQFREEVAARRARLGLAEGETVIGCPLCGVAEFSTSNQDQQ